MKQNVEIGVISDTHGLLRPKALDALEGVERINPGSAGPRRFSLPVTVARLQVSTKYIRGKIKYLEV